MSQSQVKFNNISSQKYVRILFNGIIESDLFILFNKK